MADCLEIEDRARVRWIWMNRPAERNALYPALISGLRKAFVEAATAAQVRVVVLAGRGKAFSAGADLNWMRAAARYTQEENRADAAALADMLDSIHRCPRPVIARVHGPAVGGGVGLVAATDIAVAATDSWLQLPEVRLGLIPAVILPYVIEALGPRQARRMALTAERVAARKAEAWGLVHETVPGSELDARIEYLAGELVQGGRVAQSAAKGLAQRIGSRPIDAAIRDETACAIAETRASEEAQEGMAAFFERRPPRWPGQS